MGSTPALRPSFYPETCRRRPRRSNRCASRSPGAHGEVGGMAATSGTVWRKRLRRCAAPTCRRSFPGESAAPRVGNDKNSAVRARLFLRCKRSLLALFGRRAMSDLSPERAPKLTSASASELSVHALASQSLRPDHSISCPRRPGVRQGTAQLTSP